MHCVCNGIAQKQLKNDNIKDSHNIFPAKSHKRITFEQPINKVCNVSDLGNLNKKEGNMFKNYKCKCNCKCGEETNTFPKSNEKWHRNKSPSIYHRNCTEPNDRKPIFTKTKLPKTIPSQGCRQAKTKTQKNWKNECYCNRKSFLQTEIMDKKANKGLFSDTLRNKQILQTAKKLLNYSPRSEFLQQLRKEASDIIDPKLPFKKNIPFEYTERRKMLEEDYENYEECACYGCRCYKTRFNKNLRNKNFDIFENNNVGKRRNSRKLFKNSHDTLNDENSSINYKDSLNMSKNTYKSLSSRDANETRYTNQSKNSCDTLKNDEISKNYKIKFGNKIPRNSSAKSHDTSEKYKTKHKKRSKSSYNASESNSSYMKQLIDSESEEGTLQDLDDIKTNERVRNAQVIRDDNYFECHSTENLLVNTILHKCVHRFVLDDRLLPKPLNTDKYGFSRCIICNKPMSTDLTTKMGNSQFPQGNDHNDNDFETKSWKKVSNTKISTGNMYRTINIGNDDNVIELLIPEKTLPESVEIKFPKIQPQLTWSLRYQKRSV